MASLAGTPDQFCDELENLVFHWENKGTDPEDLIEDLEYQISEIKTNGKSPMHQNA